MGMMSIVMMLGGLLLEALFTPKPKDQWGSRISNINVPPVSPGTMIPRVWGTMKIPAFMIFASELIETMHTHEASKKGGKGMFGNSAKNYTFTYSIDAAWAVCVGPAYSINRLWANQKLLWSSPQSQANEQDQFDAAYQSEATRLIGEEGVDVNYAACSAFVFAFNNYVSSEITLSSPSDAANYIDSHPIDDTNGITGQILTPEPTQVNIIIGQPYSGLNNQNIYESQINRFDNMDIYLGTDYQTPDPLLEGYLGQGNAPSFRNCVYFVMTNLQLADFGNSVPQITVEVQMNSAGTTTVTEVLSSVCQQAGLTDDQFDATSNVDPTPFQGFAVTANTSAREILMELQKVFPINTAESGYKVVFASLNQRPRQVVNRGDLAAHADTDPIPESVNTTIQSDYDLPQRINLKFQEPARSFSPNTLYAARYNTPSRSIEDLDVTIALDRDDAQHYVNNLLGNRLLGRRSYQLMLPRKYITLEPTDTFKMANKYTPRVLDGFFCTQVNVGVNGQLEVHATDFAWQDPSLKPVDSMTPDLNVSIAGNTELPTTCPTLAYLFDGPLLTDTTPDQPGFYVVLAGIQNEWQGGQLQVDEASETTANAYGGSWSSPSSGSQWQSVASNAINVPVGVVMNSLATDVVGCYWDRESVLMVKIYNGMTLQAANETDMMSQTLNATLIGNEVVAYADVQDMGKWENSSVGGSVAVQNNGSAVTGAATTLNFVNATSVTNSGGNVTVTLPTGGGDGGGSSALASDTDVTITSPADGDVLTYVAATSKWENKPAGGGGAMTPPVSTNFTAQQNTNAATITDRSRGVLLPCMHVTPQNATPMDADSTIYCVMEAGSFSGITCKVKSLMYGVPASEWAGAGIAIRDGANGYIFYLWISADGTEPKIFHTLGTGGATSFAGGGLDGNQAITDRDVFLHVDYVTETQTAVCSISNNGLDKQQIFTMAGVIVNPAYAGPAWSGQYYGPSTGGSAGGPIYDFLHWYAGSSGQSGL